MLIFVGVALVSFVPFLVFSVVVFLPQRTLRRAQRTQGRLHLILLAGLYCYYQALLRRTLQLQNFAQRIAFK